MKKIFISKNSGQGATIESHESNNRLKVKVIETGNTFTIDEKDFNNRYYEASEIERKDYEDFYFKDKSIPKSMIVVCQPIEDSQNKLKDILPTYLKVNIEADNYQDLIYLTFDTDQKLPDLSYGNTPKEVLEQYLVDNDFYTIDLNELDNVKKSLENIKTKFIDKILEDTPYLDTKNLFYMSPMNEWSKKGINEAVKQVMSVEKDFEIVDDFLRIDGYVRKDDMSESFYHDINCEVAANNFRGASHLISNLEDRYKLGNAVLESIERNLNDVTVSLDEAKNLVSEHQKELKTDTNLKVK